ncbi:MGMT family protein [Lysinibacter sp. HNR]|uniref:MGMT family protein n=1 Tax=Lysinibacter sp. HNR TaxID=3031408 RepID=UPI0024351780|nr:MGMT family protein [Lysinibacter sp. HNR]WGD38010.1 MGMT family protein [Lysinibacter sp. HNR]
MALSRSTNNPESSTRNFTAAVLDLVAQIPTGRVMSYGAVAATLGSRAARQVGKIMAHHGASVPWWRVVRADGHPPDSHAHAAHAHYLKEGTPLVASSRGAGYRVNMKLAAMR